MEFGVHQVYIDGERPRTPPTSSSSKPTSSTPHSGYDAVWARSAPEYRCPDARGGVTTHLHFA
jgi:hypothetical protein